jgi:hypothetical protein
LSHILNLFAIAFVDGEFHSNEYDLIFKIAFKSGITQEELKKILQNPERIAFLPPETEEEKMDQLCDMIKLIMVDNEIHEREIALCRYYSVKLGLPSWYPDMVIEEELKIDAMRKRLEGIGKNNNDNPLP